jgi:hypothetical protein
MTVNRKSGPHPSLHPQGGEVREVQFLVERECPEPGDFPTNLREHPAPIFVIWAPLHVSDLQPDFVSCSSPHFFQLTGDEAERLGYDTTWHDWYVCEHIGRLIE